MADVVHAPAMAPPVRTDEQIMPRICWVPIGKSNCYLNEEKSQPSPIYKIVVDILKQTNFFRAFTASSTIPGIYIQQFWDTICFDNKAGSYKCQLDEQWFDLTKDTLRDSLQITPVDNNRAFSPPLTPDTLVEFVNKLGYPKEVIHLSNVTTNDMFQPWRGVVNRAHIDYAERMWEEFTQSIHTFTENKRNLAQHTMGKKKSTLILIPSIRFTKLIIFHLQRLRNFHPRHESPLHLPNKEQALKTQKKAILAKVQEESLTEAYPTQRVPLPLWYSVEPELGKHQPTAKRRTPVPSEPVGHEESSSLYAELGLSGSDTDVLARPNLKHSDVEITDASSQPQPEHMDEGFIATAYPEVQENLKLTVDEHMIPEEPVSSTGTLSSLQHMTKDFSYGDQFIDDKPSEANNEKTTADTEAESMVSITIQFFPNILYMDDETTADEQAYSSGEETISSSDFPVPTNNWASALKTTYVPPPENSLLAQTSDIATFIDWYCKRQGISELTPKDLEGPAYEFVKVFHPDVVHLQFQMEESHKLLTNKVDDAILKYNVSKPLPLGGKPGHITIQSDFFFNKDLEYLRYGRKIGRPALSISKMKAAFYPDVGLEQLRQILGAKIIRLIEIHKFSDGNSTPIDEGIGLPSQRVHDLTDNPGRIQDFGRRKTLDNPLVSVEVLRYDYKRSNVRIREIVRTEMELVLEHTQQGTSNEVSTSEDNIMDPVISNTNLPSHSRSSKDSCFISHGINTLHRLSHSEIDEIEKRTSKYGDFDGYTFDGPILILEILSRRFLLRGIYLITGASKDGDGDTSFQWSQFTTQCSHLMFPSKDIMTTE
ncbi:hypothetical protein Tco_0792323 [Tanacetum coccineum]